MKIIQPPDLRKIVVEREPPQLPDVNGDYWVFGYGSLMWNPGFNYSVAKPAQIYGYHRCLCLWSIEYRGTTESPGLVLGLDLGGSCKGIGFHVHREDVEHTIEYLRKRELNTSAYLPVLCKMHLSDGQVVDAITFIIRHRHPQHAPAMSAQNAATIIADSVGRNGPNRDYLINTVDHLNQVGLQDARLQRIADLLM